MAYAALNARLRALTAAGLYRRRICQESRQGKWVTVDGRQLLNFASNDYLGLAADTDWQAQVARCFAQHPPSASASALAGGHSRTIRAAEESLAEYFGYAECVLLPSGYQANLALLQALAFCGDTVLYDKRIHASTAAAVRAGAATPCGFRHNDTRHLTRRLEKTDKPDSTGTKVILVESLYSMDGDSPDFAALRRIKERHNAILVADEAHAFGVLGTEGRGLATGSADMAVGTLGKALGLFGAFILLPRGGTELLCNLASPFIHSTALPDAHAACAAMLPRRIARMEEQRDRVARLSRLMRTELQGLGLPVHGTAHIITLETGDEALTSRTAASLRQHGILALAARHPTVPARRAVIRLGMTALHSARDVEVCVRSLTTILRGIV